MYYVTALNFELHCINNKIFKNKKNKIKHNFYIHSIDYYEGMVRIWLTLLLTVAPLFLMSVR